MSSGTPLGITRLIGGGSTRECKHVRKNLRKHIREAEKLLLSVPVEGDLVLVETIPDCDDARMVKVEGVVDSKGRTKLLRPIPDDQFSSCSISSSNTMSDLDPNNPLISPVQQMPTATTQALLESVVNSRCPVTPISAMSSASTTTSIEANFYTQSPPPGCTCNVMCTHIAPNRCVSPGVVGRRRYKSAKEQLKPFQSVYTTIDAEEPLVQEHGIIKCADNKGVCVNVALKPRFNGQSGPPQDDLNLVIECPNFEPKRVSVNGKWMKLVSDSS